MQTRETKRPAAGREQMAQLGKRMGRYAGFGHFLLAFLLTDACLMGYIRPFGLCYALSLKENDRLWGCCGAFLGSLMVCGAREGLLYGAACIVALAADAFLLRECDARELFLPLALAGIITIIKLPFALTEGIGRVGLLALEGALTALCTYCLLLPREGEKGRVRQAVLGMMTIAAFAGLRLFGLISPAVAAAVVLTMSVTCGAVFSDRGRAGTGQRLSGAAFGLVIGAFLDMACGGGPFFAAVFGLSAVAAALMPGSGRIPFCLAFLLTGVTVLLWGFAEPRAMGCIYDYFIAASVFLLLPGEGTAFSETAGRRGGGMHAFAGAPAAEAASRRLRDLGRAIAALSRSAAAAEPAEEDVSVVFDRAVAAVCRNCGMARTCWIEDYVSTFGDLNDLLPGLRASGHTSPGQLSGRLAARCVSKTALCAAVNQEYMSYLRRRAKRAEAAGQARLLREQYAGISAAVDDLAGAARGDYVRKPLAEKQIARILPAYRRGLEAEVYQKDGRLHMRVGPFPAGEPWVDEGSFLRSAELALNRRFLPCEPVCGKDGDIYLYREREALRVSVSSAVRKKPGEAVCGDYHMFLHTEDGRAVVLLSDGMGTGEEAARLSKNAVELLAAFVRSGCSLVESARAVVPFLRARGSEGFATLDLLEIDLFTGMGRMIKCGAADSYQIEQGQMTAISVTALPPGADPGGSQPLRPVDLLVRDGSRIVMASDGAEIGDAGLLCRRELTAGEVLNACGQESRDDLTVLVLSVSSADKQPAGGAE